LNDAEEAIRNKEQRIRNKKVGHHQVVMMRGDE
jgi:hypothetical protein